MLLCCCLWTMVRIREARSSHGHHTVTVAVAVGGLHFHFLPVCRMCTLQFQGPRWLGSLGADMVDVELHIHVPWLQGFGQFWSWPWQPHLYALFAATMYSTMPAPLPSFGGMSSAGFSSYAPSYRGATSYPATSSFSPRSAYSSSAYPSSTSTMPSSLYPSSTSTMPFAAPAANFPSFSSSFSSTTFPSTIYPSSTTTFPSTLAPAPAPAEPVAAPAKPAVPAPSSPVASPVAMSATSDSVNCYDYPTLSRYIMSESSDKELTVLLGAIGLACKATARACAKAGIANLFGLAGDQNSTGDDQKKLDVLSDEIFVSALTHSGTCAVLVSEVLLGGKCVQGVLFVLGLGQLLQKSVRTQGPQLCARCLHTTVRVQDVGQGLMTQADDQGLGCLGHVC